MKWSQFVRNKCLEQSRLEKALKGRLENGQGTHINLDLDLYSVISEWNSCPWTYTVYGSCSGTPEEHGGIFPHHVNGLTENPHATLYAHSFIEHPMFPLFRAWVNSASQNAINKSQGMEREEYRGIYLHALEINIPEEAIRREDPDYLTKFWAELKSGISQFKVSCNARFEHEHYERNLSKTEKLFIKLLKFREQPVFITTSEYTQRPAILRDIHPYEGFLFSLRNNQDSRYLTLKGKEGVKKITNWFGEELFDQQKYLEINKNEKEF
jgi:hypothetical protein